MMARQAPQPNPAPMIDKRTLPSDNPRRVLLMVIGKTPQVVTETIYALAAQRKPAFHPTEVHLITTLDGQREAKVALLRQPPEAETSGWFHRLRADYRLPDIRFGLDTIHLIRDRRGDPLLDVRTDAENECAADLITDQVREMTADPDCVLHVCLTGGRKTMTYFLGNALGLFGRPQDRLSHALVDAPFETNADALAAPHLIRQTEDKRHGDAIPLKRIHFIEA